MTRIAHSPDLESGAASEFERSADIAKYLIIGDGRVARHFAHYFQLEHLVFESWSRSVGEDELARKIAISSHVLLLISDGVIETFYREHPLLSTKTVLHFSGALVCDGILGAHPLMTFANELYDLETYRQIPFVIEDTGSNTDFQTQLPGLRNPHYKMSRELKPLYHALCVMSGNFTTMLWEKAFGDFESQLGLPRDVLFPYLSRTAQNLTLSRPGISKLTGPLVRGDHTTLRKHELALQSDPFLEVYQAFGSAYQKLKLNSDSTARSNDLSAADKG